MRAQETRKERNAQRKRAEEAIRTLMTPATSREHAVPIQGGRTVMGTRAPELPNDGEALRKVTVRPFRMSRYAVTNAEFAGFVAATGYRTDAERFGWSYVFHLLAPAGGDFPAPVEANWWRVVEGACWRRPEGAEGPGGSVDDRPAHPVVHMSWNDAAAYAQWAGGRLPSEAEWEFAARGGVDDARFPWGGAEPDDETVMCNIWQGAFPRLNTLKDGYLATAPVDSFAPNPFGLYNMAGNVWEWCADPFLVKSLSRAAKDRNARARAENERVVKGGSYLCHRSYCYRYRIAARSGRSPDTSAGNTGFRVAFDA